MSKFLDSAGLAKVWEKVKAYTDGKFSEIDVTLFKVVTALPTSDIDENKIYLVKSAETETGNIYTEYLYVNESWEKLGEYKSEVDLSGYVKTADMNTALAKKVDVVSGKQLSTNDYTTAEKQKLAAIAAGANNYVLPAATTSALGGVKIDSRTVANGQSFSINEISNGVPSVNIPTASASTVGLMAAGDYSKLAGIAASATADSALTIAEIEAICV